MIGTCEWTKEGAKRCKMFSTPKIQKFPQDMADYEDDSFRLVCEGYQLGRKGELVPAILQAYGRDPQSLPRQFRGAFAFALYDKRQGRLTVVNDLLSKKPIFYFNSAERLIFSTSFLELADELKAREIPLTPDELGLAMMTRHGVFFDDVTYVREISYLKPYGWLQGTQALETRFLPVPERKPVSGMDALLKEMDERFGRAVRLEYLLNADENYPQYATLSAGMDSKSVFLYAYQQGFQNDVCFTYAQSGSMDMAVPQQIAADYGCKHFFFSLDNGDVIKERERIIPLNEAQMEYCGTTGVQSFLSFMDTSKAGVVHTGLGGGEIMGDLLRPCADKAQDQALREDFLLSLGSLSQGERGRMEEKLLACRDMNEFFSLNDLRTCLNFMRTAQNSFEVASPFLEEDFFELMLSVPEEVKRGRALYRRWMDAYMPNKYRSTAFAGSVTRLSAEIFLRRAVRSVNRRLCRKTKLGMNPFEYWYRRNQTLRPWLSQTLTEDMAYLDGKADAALLAGLREAFDEHLMLRCNVLTATWALRRILE